MFNEIEKITKAEVLEYLQKLYSNSTPEAIEEFYNHRSFGESGRYYAKKAILEDQIKKEKWKIVRVRRV